MSLNKASGKDQTGLRPADTGLFYRVGAAVTGPRGRWVTVALWIVGIALLVALPPKVSSLYSDGASTGIGDQESVRAANLLKSKFPGGNALPAIIVFNNPAGLNDQDYAKAKQASDWLTSNQKPASVGSVVSINTVPPARSELVSANGTTLEIIAALQPPAVTTDLGKDVTAIRKYLEPLEGSGLTINVTGPAGVIADTTAIFSGANFALLTATVALVLVLLLIVYRSPLLAITPLVVVFVASEAVNGLLALGAQAGWFEVTAQSNSIMEVLLFGVGVDYTIFLVSRYREELQRDSDRLSALRHAYSRVSEAILSSGATVIAALLTLLLAQLGLYKSLGPSLAIGVAVMLLVGLTLVPALLSIVGRAAFWPFIPKYDPALAGASQEKIGLWGRLARMVAKHPARALWISTIALMILGLGNLGVIDVFNFLTGFRQPTDSADGYKVLAANFQPGALAPTDVLLVSNNGTNLSEKTAAVTQVSQAIAAVPNVAKVGRPTFSTDNTVARLQVTLKTDPYGETAMDTVQPLRDTVKNTISQSGLGGTSLVGGVSAQNADTRAVNNADKLLIIPVVVILTTLILGLLLRSVVAPLYLIVAVLLNFFATVGAASFLFVTIQGDDGRSYAIPLYAFIFLVSLGADYTIFLMTRVREEVVEHGLEAGTVLALSRTGGVITSAGLILAGTFLVLTILPIRELYQLGVIVGLGVILDTFVVRGVVVPSTVLLLKKFNWWPSRLNVPETAALDQPTEPVRS
ncbi:MAG: MMPL family transporter [Chloroflexi bacterium]|nr:MMPL family transporter [Chloroflexota bacterium]OJW06545.1 MAG: hypothetical protein BGO39_00610 [Chloroflexi bacterium 54-19]